MVYSEVINNNLQNILPVKTEYRKSDIKLLMLKGYTEKQSQFIVKCTAIYNGSEWRF